MELQAEEGVVQQIHCITRLAQAVYAARSTDIAELTQLIAADKAIVAAWVIPVAKHCYFHPSNVVS